MVPLSPPPPPPPPYIVNVIATSGREILRGPSKVSEVSPYHETASLMMCPGGKIIENILFGAAAARKVF